MVASPWVRQCVGTESTSPPKKRALSIRVCLVSVLMRVREASEDPGSLNAMCPSVPIPRICRSTPPAARIAFSYAAHAAGMSAARPSGPCDRAGSEVDPGHEHRVDDVPVPLRMIGGQADVLVEGETAGLPERDQPRRRSAPPVRRRSPAATIRWRGPSTAAGLRSSRAPIASAATPPISLASGRMTTSIYLFAVKRSCAGGDLRTGGDRVGRNDVLGFAFVHDHNGDNGIESLGLDRRDVVGDDELARGDVVTLADVGREAFALQRDGVQTQVHQNAHVVRGHDDVGVRHQFQELAADRGDRVDHPARRVDGGAVAHHALGEHGSGTSSSGTARPATGARTGVVLTS